MRYDNDRKCFKCDESQGVYLNHGHCTNENVNYDSDEEDVRDNVDDDCLR